MVNSKDNENTSSTDGGYGSFLWWKQKPSASSTEAATNDSSRRRVDKGGNSYQQAAKDNDETSALLEQGGGNGMNGYHDNVTKKHGHNKTDEATQKKRKVIGTWLLVVALVAIGAWFFVGRHHHRLPSSLDPDGQPRTSRVPFPFAVDQTKRRRPLSTLHPVHDLGVRNFTRPATSRPPVAITGGATQDHQGDDKNEDSFQAYPTNAWYQNMLLVRGEPSNLHRAYATPFIVDTVGPIPGLRVQPNHVSASTSVVQINTIEMNGLTVGAAPYLDAKPKAVAAAAAIPSKTTTNSTASSSSSSSSPTPPPPGYNFTYEYSVERMTPLGLTLAWEKSYPMSSNIVKGMPYGTMKYDSMKIKSSSSIDEISPWYPTVASEIALASAAKVDGVVSQLCNATAPHSSHHHHYSGGITVERDIELHFNSDFSWLVFVSKPVVVQCAIDLKTGGIQLQFFDPEDDTSKNDDVDDDDQEQPFFLRIALTKLCTTNKNPIYCHHEQMLPGALTLGQGRYDDLLRNHSQYIPGPDTSFDYVVDQTMQEIRIEFDWDVKDMRNYGQAVQADDVTMANDLIVYALPHHLDLMGTRNAPGYLKYCATTLIGPACLLSGSKWNMVERLPAIDMRAPRPPAPWAMKALATSAQHDIQFTLPKFYQKGAGDTYFSGKMLAKLGRILAVVEELKEICDPPSSSQNSAEYQEYKEVCQEVKLPSDRDVKGAIAHLRSSVEIWLNGKGVTPFVFDDEWGGVVSCGCDNPDGGDCRNKYPVCPSFTDPGLNFGNAWYNDLHFHYGYHIYAAAVVSHFDPDWGKRYFEQVLLLIRNIANPSYDGDYFPAFRHKDWYQGHSWASGVVPPYLNGRNQESSSESIAAYEAVALYGSVMVSVWEKENLMAYVQVAKDVQEAGLVAAATEIRSVRRYYHVRDTTNANQALKIYPSEYTNHAIGMLWSTMVQFQTWFGGKPYLAVGIQLLPITPISEQRDGVQWLTEMYPSFAETCEANADCETNGWSVLQLASLATIGHPTNASDAAQALSLDVFESAGGNGHSLTNTLWYIATRPIVSDPAQVGNATNTADGSNATSTEDDLHVLSHCFKPNVCTDYVLDTIADEYTCRQRITDLMWTSGHSQKDACFEVAKIQFPSECGACNPNATETKDDTYAKAQCPPCTVAQCRSSLNMCPEFHQTFVCTEGPNRGGCSRFPWDVRSAQCTGCCELTECTPK